MLRAEEGEGIEDGPGAAELKSLGSAGSCTLLQKAVIAAVKILFARKE